ncbi:DUF58 domain-containing protein [Thalassotalea profundi]|uniref:DUF58 domain-containing protein n=1 Tax=Thalassotalea profundi TaxID=2036687 RepID=A0ABQ3IQ11_9GAMM|nr:DUF58 domain-containing protein [Thalassotalea profundi]GHE90361.1 hypothetical protein GCM10011501_19690 [Thalassotalea profundi]
MNNLLDVKALSRSKDLPFVAKTLAQGFLHGSHASVQRGVGIEFSQYRAYEPGDELAKVDWKLFGRTDKYFVREAERESDTNLWFAIDSSASMAHVNQAYKNEVGALSKLYFAKILSATMGYIAQQQGDNVGCLALSSVQPVFLPLMSGYKHWQRLLLSLNKIKAGEHFPHYQHVYAQLQTMRSSGIVFLFSDFYQTHDEIYQLIKQLNHKDLEVIAVQLEANDEVEFDFDDVVRFQDLESQDEYLLSPKVAKKSYMENRGLFNQQLQVFLQKNGLTHWRINIDLPIDEILHQFIQERQRVIMK